MSQEAKRAWTACVGGCAALAAVGLVAGWLVWQGGVRPAVAAEAVAGPGATLLDPVQHAGVSELRGRVRLADDTLAAIACSQASAETILGKLPTWWGTNRVAWLGRMGSGLQNSIFAQGPATAGGKVAMTEQDGTGWSLGRVVFNRPRSGAPLGGGVGFHRLAPVAIDQPPALRAFGRLTAQWGQVFAQWGQVFKIQFSRRVRRRPVGR